MPGPAIDEDFLQATLAQEGIPHTSPVSQTLRASAVWASGQATAPDAAAAAERGGGADAAADLPKITLGPAGQGDGGPGAAPPPDYEVTGVLAEGGMGRLLLARQRSLGREVVIKQVKPGASSETALRSLLAEARFVGALEHPSIVPVHALGRDEAGRPLMVMKRIEGVPWSALVDDPAHQAWERVAPSGGDRLRAHLEVMLRVCDAIHYAHSRGVLHRDIKLDNVMVGYFGEVYLVDWGVAMWLHPGRPARGPIVGTPIYMAPEMLCGHESAVDERTDVYLLGATLHHALTRRPRHEGESLIEVLLSAQQSAPAALGPQVPAELAELCNRCTRADPASRPPSALALRGEIEAFLRHRSSIELADRMAAALDALASEVADPPPHEAERWATHRRLIETRFGLEQALQGWPDNPRAAEALRRCRGLQLDHALARSNLDEAQELAAELGDPGPERQARLGALAARRQAEARAAETLSRIERDQDPSVGAAQRRFFFGSMAVLITAVSVALNTVGVRVEDMTPRRMALISLVAFAAATALLLVSWKRLADSALHRRILLAFYLIFTALGLQRLFGVLMGEPVVWIVINGFPVLLSGIVVGAVGIHRVFWRVAVPQLGCWVLILLWPERIPQLFPLAAVLACLILILSWPARAPEN